MFARQVGNKPLPPSVPNDVHMLGQNSSVVCVLGSLSSVIQQCRFDPAWSNLVERIFTLELTLVLTLFPRTLSVESLGRGPVCAHMHSIAWTQKILTFMSSSGEGQQAKHPACTIHEDGM